MTASEPGGDPVVVAVDTSPHSRAALEAAARWAQVTGAELLGVFVEDVELLRLGALPLVREVSAVSGHGNLEAAALERSLRAMAATARRELQQAAGRHGVRASFRVVRGAVAAELRLASQHAPLIVLGRMGHGLTRHRGSLGSAARNLLVESRSLLISARRRLIGGRILVIESDPALPEVSEGAERLLRALQRPLVSLPVHAQEALTAVLARLTQREALCAVVLSRRTPLPPGLSLEQLVESLDCTVLVVP